MWRVHRWSCDVIGGRWWARYPRSPPKKTALHTKSAQTAGLEAIWCEVRRKILRNTPVWWLFRL
ncbi:hypothetical protein BXA19_11075 [Corynebacterium diphtheriae]|nr:hypothetical protein BUE67_11015 [Corynebacterium diphtheriae]OLO13535.1 hypothetical protein BUV99_11055 [Corynebacterium diphtheriae]OLO21123.1 hypothetical protein BVH76_11105 [Corynebacterium diphtheriae]OLO21261.1 hypothetical protein BVH78_11035 [Corynebacterium diphtheriae]OMO43305.1 hypothetical protein BVL41_11030 [Corynebacterium diphtheriae]